MAYAAPRTEYDVLRDLDRYDCSLARECGTFDQAKVDALRAELAMIRAKGEQKQAAANQEFLVAWSREITIARRAEWNGRVKAGEFGKTRINISAVRNAEKAQGWTFEDLKRAVKLHNLK